MGIGGNSRREANRLHQESLRQQQQAYNEHNERLRREEQYRLQALEPIRQQNTNAANWLTRFNAGEDIGSLNPASARNMQMASDQVAQTFTQASQIGDSRYANEGHQAKLNSVAMRNIARGYASIQEESLLSELGNQRGILMDTTNMLTSNSMANVNASSDLVGMSNMLVNNAANRLQMERQRSQMALGNVMSIISGGVSAGMTVMGAGGLNLFNRSNASSGNSGGGSNFGSSSNNVASNFSGGFNTRFYTSPPPR